MEIVSKEEYARRRAKWMAALRSGNFEQTTGWLRNKHGYCCLGVACAVSPFQVEIVGENFTWLDADTALPYELVNYYGMMCETGSFRLTKEVAQYLGKEFFGNDKYPELHALTDMNDSGTHDFKQIADFIEKYPHLIFKEGTF